MGVQLQPASSEDEMAQVSDINVTPFIDVILVLVDHFHDRRAAGDRRYRCRPAGLHRDAPASSGQADLHYAQSRRFAGGRRDAAVSWQPRQLRWTR